MGTCEKCGNETEINFCGYCINELEEKKCDYNEKCCMNNIPYLIIKCLNCHKESMLYKYHDMYKIPSTITDINGIVTKEEGYIILVCSNCNKKMKLINIKLELINDENT